VSLARLVRVAALGLAVCLAPPLTVARAADDEAAVIEIAGLRLGDQVAGPAVSAAALAHRVVVLEFWGVHCPPCIRSMPALEQLHREYSAAGLTVIGAHAQQASVEEIREVVEQLGVTFPIVASATVEGGMDFSGIPHCMVFDHTGACVYRGHPNRAHDVIVAAVRSSPAAVLEGRTLVKLAPLASQLRDEGSFGGVLRRAQGQAAAKDKEIADEAAYLVGKLEAHGRRLLDAAEAAKAEDPLRALHFGQRCATAYRGTALGREAAELVAAWKKDEAFQDGLEAARQCRKLEVARARIAKSLGDPEQITPAMAERIPEGVRRQLAATAASVQRLGPGSASAERAEAIAEELGLSVVR
jgi:thiol-disulfide isomerase/thioredoxin